MSLDEHKYTLLRLTATIIEQVIPRVCPRFPSPLPICSKAQQGAKKLRIGIAWSLETEIPSKEEWVSIFAAANEQAASENALIGKITLGNVNDKRASQKEKDVKCVEVLINISGTMPTGPAATKAKRGTELASKGMQQVTAEHMPVLQGDSIASAYECLLFEIKRTLPELNAAAQPSSSSSPAPSSASSNFEALLADRLTPILLQFKNASYANGFISASSIKK